MIDLAVLGQDPRLRGGSHVQTEAFVRAALELGRKPQLFFLSYRGLRGRSMPSLPIPSASVPGVVPGLDGLNQLVAASRLASSLRRARSIWVVTTVASHGFGAVRAGRPYGVWVGTSLEDEWSARRHGLSPSRRAALALSAPLLRRLERETVRDATRVYATSPASRAAVARAAGIDPEEMALLSIPVDTALFSPASDTEWHTTLAERPTIVFLGRRDDPRKNLPLLLHAFDRVRSAIPRARLLLAGSGPAPGVAEPGVETVDEVEDVPSFLRRATLLALPSLQEGFGIVAAEALACGVPVVTTPSGGPEELVRRSGGGCVVAGFDADDLASALVRLLRDPEALAAMRVSGREYVEREHAPARFRAALAAAMEAVDRR